MKKRHSGVCPPPRICLPTRGVRPMYGPQSFSHSQTAQPDCGGAPCSPDDLGFPVDDCEVARQVTYPTVEEINTGINERCPERWGYPAPPALFDKRGTLAVGAASDIGTVVQFIVPTLYEGVFQRWGIDFPAGLAGSTAVLSVTVNGVARGTLPGQPDGSGGLDYASISSADAVAMGDISEQGLNKLLVNIHAGDVVRVNVVSVVFVAPFSVRARIKGMAWPGCDSQQAYDAMHKTPSSDL